MENLSVPDLAAAARHLENAHTSLAEATKALRKADGTELLDELGRKFSVMAEAFRNGMLLAGLKVTLVDSKMAGSILASCATPNKLKKLAVARAKLAEKRRLAKLGHESAKRKSPESMGLRKCTVSS
jgi:hypothetical protein